MPKEIERKFLVKNEDWRPGHKAVEIRQGYMCSDKLRTVRVRTKGDKSYLTIKGPNKGMERDEFEYEIPFEDATYMLGTMCEQPLIEKRRFEIKHAGKIWEVDEFFGDNAGLIVAEVELESASDEVEKPDWIGEEVTEDARYYNSSLSRTPFTKW
ncbi:MAG: CYTH domain-containing protein [Candidatus Obscuribacterales bacterium]|nr:CYTH domain-containing protein [Candidatus Obscuribacterales bacterium]